MLDQGLCNGDGRRSAREDSRARSACVLRSGPLQRSARVALVLLLASAPATSSELVLPAVFGDHMVLQCGARVPVWGRAEAQGEVRVSIAGQQRSTVVGADGAWRVEFEDLAPGGPHVLCVQGEIERVFEDVWIGEVWLGAGQSNMALPVEVCDDFEAERAAAERPTLRMFTTLSAPYYEPAEDVTGEWVVCSPATVGAFSGTLYFFGQELQRSLGRPVGLINSSVGGSQIQSWISLEAQLDSPELREGVIDEHLRHRNFDPKRAARAYAGRLTAWEASLAESQTPPPEPGDPREKHRRQGAPGGLFNGHIAPLIPYALRGVLWYQGEANAGQRAALYEHQLPLLVRDWRRQWQRDDLPFAWVQLPNYSPPRGLADWPSLRETMRRTLALPHTGMAITIDIGKADDIHPPHKQGVGKRLAAWALGEVYGLDVVTSGPLPATHAVQGAEFVVRFVHADGGLVSRGGQLRGFEILSSAGAWYSAEARIQGDAVHASSPAVDQPSGLRYAWANDPDGNLFNGAGLPASPFLLP